MFDVGFWEILLILILALVVIGPERLPGAARKAGYFFGKARRYIEGVRSEVESELDVSEFKRMLHNQEVQINELQQQLKAGAEKIAADIPDASSLDDGPSHSIEDESDADRAGASTGDNDDSESTPDMRADTKPVSAPGSNKS